MTSEATFWIARMAVGVSALGLGAWAAWRLYAEPAAHWIWRLGPLVIGGVLGFLAANFAWSYTPDFVIVGFPFPVAFSRMENGRWVDHISGQVGVLFLANLAVSQGLASTLAYCAYRLPSVSRPSRAIQ